MAVSFDGLSVHPVHTIKMPQETHPAHLFGNKTLTRVEILLQFHAKAAFGKGRYRWYSTDLCIIRAIVGLIAAWKRRKHLSELGVN